MKIISKFCDTVIPLYSERLALHSIIETNAKKLGYSEPAYSENQLIVNAFDSTASIKSLIL
jgi:hypothetical protein